MIGAWLNKTEAAQACGLTWHRLQFYESTKSKGEEDKEEADLFYPSR